jgi:SPP1 family predicted phage head-tail adaptor
MGNAIPAGRLNRLVKIQAQTSDQDDTGQPLNTWADVASVWADIRLPNGLETIKAGATVSIVQASVRIRYRTDVTAGMRVLQGPTVYEILAVMPDVAGRRFTDLACQVVA